MSKLKLNPNDSPALDLLQVLWTNRQQETGHSWLRLNHAMWRGLLLAVEMGLTFHPDDFSECYQRYRAGYWIGDGGGEMFYQHAVLYGNATAWQSYEQHVGRKAFIIPGARCDRASGMGNGLMGGGLARLVVGARFNWKGELVTVTSFKDGDDPQSFVACSYKKAGKYKEKIHHRFAITHQDIRDEKKARKEAAKAEAA